MVFSHWWQQPKTSGSIFLLVQNLVEASIIIRKNSSTLNLFTPSCTTHFLNLLLLVLFLECKFFFLPPFFLHNQSCKSYVHVHAYIFSSFVFVFTSRYWYDEKFTFVQKKEKMDWVGGIHCLWELDVDPLRWTWIDFSYKVKLLDRLIDFTYLVGTWRD